ncbi:MAG: hypothetical protein HYV09_24110 [Deltaproteobacteria bacterium]|nr:hypothetical protein [Deltaproteobacteria bacterium]
MFPSPEARAEIRRDLEQLELELARQDRAFDAVLASVPRELLESQVQLGESFDERLAEVLRDLDRARPRPAPVFGVRM